MGDLMLMQAEPGPLQLLFIELRVGLARSAIQAGMLLNGVAAIAVFIFLAITAGRTESPDFWRLKLALLVFGLGVFLASATFVNAYVAQGALASGQASSIGTLMRRLGLGLITASLLLFLAGLLIAVSAL
jgi:hypothetical protein